MTPGCHADAYNCISIYGNCPLIANGKCMASVLETCIMCSDQVGQKGKGGAASYEAPLRLLWFSSNAVAASGGLL